MSSQLLTKSVFANVIRDRHSIRHYDSSVTISKEELTALLDEAILAPSSANLQPWRFLVIDSQEQKEKLHPIANNQQQVLDASAVIAVLGDLQFYTFAETIFERAVQAGYMNEEIKNHFVANINKVYETATPETVNRTIYTDGGLISMQLMLVAKAMGYDTVPMGGYNREKFIEAFGLGDRYIPIMLIAIGKALKPGHQTVRLSVDEVTFWNEIVESSQF